MSTYIQLYKHVKILNYYYFDCLSIWTFQFPATKVGKLEEIGLATQYIADQVSQFMQADQAGLLTSTAGEGSRVNEVAAATGIRAESRDVRNEVTMKATRLTSKVVRKSPTAHYSARKHCFLNPPQEASLLHQIQTACLLYLSEPFPQTLHHSSPTLPLQWDF